MTPILITEESWRNSQLSIARLYGRVNFDGHEYINESKTIQVRYIG